MKKYKNYIIGILLFASVGFLFGFAEKRNNARKIDDVVIQFTDQENLYITEVAVNNLLIQNQIEVEKLYKDSLDLNKVENLLLKNEMIENAQVYLTIDGKLGAKIAQRKPIGRVQAKTAFYVDRNGEKMPLSPFHSARVPLVTGVNEAQVEEAFAILDYIKKDEFLTQHITAINRKKNGFYMLEVRGMDFQIAFGRPRGMETKFNNFKSFYQNGLKNNKLNLYKTVNLQFGNQVVATKK